MIALAEQLRAAEDLDRFLDEAEIGLAAVDVPQAREAPLLFVGDDFGTTGVIAALGPDPA